MIIETGRFGKLNVELTDIIEFPQGILGFPEYKKYCLIDPADDTLILWLLSIDNPEVCFPVLEPKIFKSDYAVRLSGAELRDLKLTTVKKAAVYSILTIPENISEMTANLKAPIVINLEEQVAKQAVLQENDYNIKHAMFKELRGHILTILASKRASSNGTDSSRATGLIPVKELPPSLAVRSLDA